MEAEARLKVSASPFASWLHNELFRAAALHKSSGTVSAATSFCDPLVAVDGKVSRRHRPFSLLLYTKIYRLKRKRNSLSVIQTSLVDFPIGDAG